MSYFGSSRYSPDNAWGGYGSGRYDRYSSGYNNRYDRYDRYGAFDSDFGNDDSSDDGYSSEDPENITFFRPDGDTEGKSIHWCKSNGFFRIRRGLWSGNWYYKFHPDEEKPNKDISEYSCPIAGCHETFETEANVQRHLQLCNGKAHVRYRVAHNIPSRQEEEVKTCTNELIKSFSKGSTKSAQTNSTCRPCVYDYDYEDVQSEAYGLERDTEELRKLGYQRAMARKKQRKEPKPLEEEPPKKKSKQSSASPDDVPKKRCAFAILMKSGGVAKKKTPKKKVVASVIPVPPAPTKPPNNNNGPPVVETVYAFYARKKKDYGDDYCKSVAGFEFHFSDLSTQKFGRTVGVKKSKPMELLEKEFITAISIDKMFSSVRFYTSHWSGRVVKFGQDEIGLDDPFEEGGNQGDPGDFNAEKGRMITGINMSGGEITGVLDQEAPEGWDCDW